MRPSLDIDGAVRLPRFLSEDLVARLETILGTVDHGEAGVRLTGIPELAAWIENSGLSAHVSERLKAPSKGVRAILFDKSPAANWALGWHQDRTLAVAGRHEVQGYGPWTQKAGIDHVEPPFALIERMLTARIHIDPVTSENAPLEIVLRSHRLGKVLERDLDVLSSSTRTYSCLAERGDVWLYRTSIVHASASSRAAVRRRVLQIDFSSDALPPPLEWLGMG